ncbi:hypothetical protein F7725_012360, partial [Dissostichus mawsoni]
MDSYRRGKPWGKLVKVNSSETVLLFNRECTVGRKKGCYLSFPANKLVSGEHCKIVQDERSGQAWLEDMSTNGTVINMSKLVKKQTHMLQNGDVIYFVYRKVSQNKLFLRFCLLFHLIYSFASLLTPTLFLNSRRGAVGPQSCSAPPSEMPLSVEPVMLTKAPRDPAQEEPQPSTSSSHFCIGGPTTSVPVATTACPAPGQAKDAAPLQEEDLEPESKRRKTEHGQAKDAAPLQEEDLEPESKRRKTEHEKYYDLPHTSSGEVVDSAKASVLTKAPVEGTKTDKMEESLTCPCMHVFCAACYSGWMERSSLCPTCRCPVERIRKNHILNNLVEAYLIQHPEKCRSEQDLKGMDGRNKITQDMLQPKVERSSQPLVECRQCPSFSRDISLPMPDRRAEPNNEQRLAQQCVLCQRPFCHMYWGCQRIGCQGCLARFSELNLTDKCLDGVLNNNNYESEILQSWRDVLQESLQALQQGNYYLSDCRISPNAILCYCCGLRSFKELAYKFRQNIAAPELP